MSQRGTAAMVISAAMVLFSRLSHLNLVWVEEAYGLAAAQQLLYGRHLYSEVWFDKPPVYAWFYLLNGANQGWPLRMLDIIFTLTLAWALARATAALWKSVGPEPTVAFCLTSFALTFWIPSAVIAVAPDQLVLLPLVIGVLCACKGQSLAAGICAGIAVLCNSKGVVALPIMLLWTWRSVHWSVAGFFGVQVLSLIVLPAAEYWQQVWRWGLVYSSDSFIADPLAEGLRRTAAWLGFYAGIVILSGVALTRERSWKLWSWLTLSFLTVVGGFRFFPRYYFVLIPVMVVTAARGWVLLNPFCRTLVLLVFTIPLVRFGPRYAALAIHGDVRWSDTALMEDSREAAAVLAHAGSDSDSTLLVWGYRPELYVFSGMRAGTPFLDSQPLTGVLADRHLTSNQATFPDLAHVNRARLTGMQPVFVADGLGPLNPALGIGAYPDLAPWLSRYERIGATRFTTIFKLRRNRGN